MKVDKITAIFDAVKENMERTDKCEGPHEFVAIADDPYRYAAECTKCGGRFRKEWIVWYHRGLKHGSEGVR